MPDDRPIAEKLRAKLAGPAAADVATRKRDLMERITAAKALLRGGPLTVGRDVTAEGHLTSAITVLQRELEKL